MNVKISVVIPVYNVQKYLRQCLDSVINQTFKDIEIICINDGSTDNCLNILQDYAEKDRRIKFINQENKGPSSARNHGIDIASGKYICFVDSDDILGKSFCEKSYKIAEDNNLEMVIGASTLYYYKENKFIDHPSYSLSLLNSSLDNITFTWRDIKEVFFQLNVAAWGRLYRLDYLKKINAYFPEGLWFEDNPFYIKTMLMAKKIRLMRGDIYTLYLYRKGIDTSITSNNGRKNLEDRFTTINLCENILKEVGFYHNLKKEFLDCKISIYWRFIFNHIDKKYRQIALTKIKEDLLNIDVNLDELSRESQRIYTLFYSSNSSYFILLKHRWQNLKNNINKFIGKIGQFIKVNNLQLYNILVKWKKN